MSLLSEALDRIEKEDEKKREEKVARMLVFKRGTNALEDLFPELLDKGCTLCSPGSGLLCGRRWLIQGRHGMISISMHLDAPGSISIVREGPSGTLDKRFDFTPNMECVSQQAIKIANHIAMLMTLAEMPLGSCVG